MFVHPPTKVIPVRSLIFLAVAGLAWSNGASARAADHYRWSVQYLLDQSQSVFGRPQTTSPRNNRGLALSPDRKHLYAAYIWTINKRNWTSKGELRKINLSEPDYENATVALLPSPIAKDLAVDSAGRVYAAMGSHITVYDADLAHELYVIPTSICDGVAVTQAGSQTILYSSEREQHTLRRFEVYGGTGGAIAGVKQTGFDSGSGEILMPDGSNLRGVAVDTHGRIWVADVGGNRVFRVEPSGKDLKSLPLNAPMGIAFDGPKGYVTLSKDREVAIIDDEMHVAGAVSVPWQELELSPWGNNHEGILAGIVVDPGKGFWVANAHGQTANQRSTYGRVDQSSDVLKGKLYTDSFADDNDPILHAVLTAPDSEGAHTAVAPAATPEAFHPPTSTQPAATSSTSTVLPAKPGRSAGQTHQNR